MKKFVLFFLIVSLIPVTLFILLSCGGGGSSGGSSSGSVALYVTDDPGDDYKQVTLTINSVSLVHTGSNTACEVLSTPVSVDLTELVSVLKLLDITTCPKRSYNRIHLELAESATLIKTINDIDVMDTCFLKSYKDKNNNPNVLSCTGSTCSIDISGAVNVLAKQKTGLALDFDLKDFEVNNFNSLSSECTVTMKVSPLNASNLMNHTQEISGYISNLDTVAKTFTLTTESGAFAVSYINVTTPPPGIDELLTLAQTDQLEVEVKSSSIDLTAMTIDASRIFVEIEGTVSNLDDLSLPKTFTLTYGTGSTITVDYTSDEVEGVLANDVTAEVELEGYNSTSEHYLAHEVEVKQPEVIF